jgi:hypothetical protein
MKKTGLSVLGAVTLASGIAAPEAKAANFVLNIDDFNAPASPGSQKVDDDPTSTSPDFSESGPLATTSVLGGFRDLDLNPGTGDSNLVAQGVVTNGFLFWSNPADFTSTLLTTWDGQDNSPAVNTSPGLGGWDFTSLEDIEIGIASTDLSGLQIKVDLFTKPGNVSSFTSTPFSAIPSTAPVAYKINKASFAGTVNYSEINAVRMTLTGPKEIDVKLDYIKANLDEDPTPPAAVPEPGTLAGIGAIAGLAALSKKRRFSF